MNDYRLFPILFIILMLVACGGGTEGGGEQTPPDNCSDNTSQKINNRSQSNWAIVADAGKNQQAVPGAEVSLDASSSYAHNTKTTCATSTSSDALASLSYQWSLIDKPDDSNPVISDPNAVNPRLKTDTPGTYRLKLEVATPDGASNSTEIEIEVDPEYQGPNIQVDAGKNQFVGTNSNVTINEGNDTIISGDNITYQWVTVNNLPSTTVINNITNINIETHEFQPLQFSPDIAGDYQFKLVIKNGDGKTSEDEITIKVAEGKNSIPVADAGKDLHHRVNDAVNLSVVKSYDADSDILSYQWFFSAKPDSSSAIFDNTDAKDVSFIADVEGTYVATLRVRDGKEASGDNISSEFDSVMIIVTKGNNAPVAFAGANFSMIVGKTTQLYAGSSYDIDGDELSYQWSVEQLPSGSAYSFTNEATISPSITPDMQGDYVIKLIVTDKAGLVSDPTTITITVNPTPPDTTAPITIASPPGGSYDAAQSVTLTCSDNDGSGCKNTYFTTDGSQPSIDSDIYTVAINVNEDMTLKYFSVDHSDNVEATITQEYIISETNKTMTITHSDSLALITSDIEGIHCGDVCVAEYPANTQIVLTATHSEQKNAVWSGCTSIEENKCSLPLTNDVDIRVNFVSNMTEDESNDTFETADNVVGSNIINGFYNAENDIDYYSFEITERGTFQVSITHNSVRSFIKLYDTQRETLVDSGGCCGSKNHTITYTLDPGSYYLSVASDSKLDLATPYNLSLTGTVFGISSPDQYEANDSFDTATKITTTGAYQGFFDTQNDSDYYVIEVAAAGTFYAIISHNSVFSYLTLYDNFKEQIGKTNVPKKIHTLTYSLAPGTYYIQVISYDTAYDLDTAYNLQLSGTVLGNSSPDGYEENDTFDTATEITSAGTYQGYFDTQNDSDYYVIDVTSAGTLHATITHNKVLSYIYLYDNFQEKIINTGLPEKNKTLTYSLTPGTYYIRVVSYGKKYDLDNAYNLQLSGTVLGSTSPDRFEENNSFDTATEITRADTYQGYFDTQNDSDYYVFEVISAGTLHATISHNKVSSYIYLYNNAQKEKTRTDKAKTGTLTYSLTPGVHYIRVISYRTEYDLDNAYDLQLSGTVLGSSSPDSHEENDSFNTATTVTSAGAYQGYFDTQTDSDYYVIDVTSTGTFYATISHNTVSSYIYLYDSAQKQMTRTERAKTGTLTYSLTPGVYYIRVISYRTEYDLDTVYDLQFSGTVLGSSSPDSHEENDTFNTATAVASTGSYQGYFDTQNDSDYYVIDVASAGTLGAIISHNEVSSDIYLYDSSQKQLTSTSRAKTNNTLSHSVTPGTYYVRIISNNTKYDLNAPYNLELSITQ